MTIDKRALSDDLTKSFILYQHRVDEPMPIRYEPEEVRAHYKYNTDSVFRKKVDSLVSGVMCIIDDHVEDNNQEAKMAHVLKLARDSHGVMLTSYPPQDAWTFNKVDEKINTILRESGYEH